MESLKSNAESFKYLNDSIRNDRELILEAIKINGKIFQYLKDEYKNDREIM